MQDTLKRIGKILLIILGIYLILRAIAEPFLINSSDPSTYRDDWGGPSIAGVLIVHMGLGVVSLILLVRYARSKKKKRA